MSTIGDAATRRRAAVRAEACARLARELDQAATDLIPLAAGAVSLRRAADAARELAASFHSESTAVSAGGR